MEKTNQINFQIKSIELMEVSITPPLQPLPADTVFQLDINLEHRMTLEKNGLVVVCKVLIFGDSKEHPFGILKTACVYIIEESAPYFDFKEQKHNLPETLIVTLNSISVSTTRGIMFSTFRGTFLNNVVLPIIDPKLFTSHYNSVTS